MIPCDAPFSSFCPRYITKENTTIRNYSGESLSSQAQCHSSQKRRQRASKAADRTPPKQTFEEQTFDEWKQTHPKGTRLQFQNEQARGKKTAELQAEQNAFGGGGSGKSGPDFIKSLSPGLQSQVKAFGEGRLDLSATPRGKEKTVLIQALTQAYPDFDQTKGQTWAKTRNEYMGSGQTAKKVVSYNTSLEHMQDLYDHSTFEGLYVPGSKDYSDRSVALHYVANEVGQAIKTGVMGQEEGKAILDSLKGGAWWKPRPRSSASCLPRPSIELQR